MQAERRHGPAAIGVCQPPGGGIPAFSPRASFITVLGVIATDTALAEFLPHLRAAPWVAMDTEADSLHSYPEKLCLVQIGLPGADVLVDPLAALDLGPFWAALGGRELILHGGDYDLRLLHRGPGFVPTSVFDTMLASRLLGYTEFGLTHLVRRFLNVELEKGPQRADWSRRPLTERMMAYARNDARYLRPLTEVLRAQLVEKNRLAWHAQMCRQLIEDAIRPPADDNGDAWRIKSADLLSRRGMAVLRHLWHWRESEARGANRPPFFVLSHDTLFSLAVAVVNGGTPDTLIPPRYSPRRRASLLAAIEEAASVPESEWPHPRRHRGQRLSAGQKHQLDRLRRHRDRAAEQLGMDPTLIASRGTLVRLAADWEKASAELLPWQRELLKG